MPTGNFLSLAEITVTPVFSRKTSVERVIYNDPATIVYWGDGTKTVVRCHEDDVYDERTGFLLCCAKKLFGNTGRFNDVMKEHAGQLHSLLDEWDKHPGRMAADEELPSLGATLGSGTLTAEQVAGAVYRNCKFYEGGEVDEQAIADELNAKLGRGKAVCDEVEH